MLEFQIEWLDAPGVKDRVLARTWARIAIEVGGAGPPHSLTSCIRMKAESVGGAIYGSVFPLAEWIVENWWFVLNEPIRVQDYRGARALAAIGNQREWLHRHSLLSARDGGALPDVVFYRDGPDVVVRWVPDPERDDLSRPVRFISGPGSVRMSPLDLEVSLGRLVETVLERLDAASDEDTRRLRENWTAVRQSGSDEPQLCAWAASLGVDPYDRGELTDELVALMENELPAQPALLRGDLLEATSANALVHDLKWMHHAASRLRTLPEATTVNGQRESKRQNAHEVGYQKARQFHHQLGLPEGPLPNLLDVIHEKCGWPTEPEIIIERPGTLSRFTMVGKDKEGIPRIVSDHIAPPASRRFRLARSLYFLPSADAEEPTRLATGAYTWDQRASRAFAAEVLAPAKVLRAQVGDSASMDDVDRLADEYGVSSWVIERQLVNHGIASIDVS
jgi:hypothetical protein